MLLRSLIVLLVVLNLGVAAWWALHTPPTERPLLQPAGVPRLQLREEAPPARTVAPAPPAAAPMVRTSRPVAPPVATTACTGEDAGADGWRVYLPPQPSLAAADTMAGRIAEAGFSDYLVMREGAEANAIALGRYSTREAAQRRIAALQAGGFAARCARIEAQ